MFKIYGRANSINVRKVLWICDEIGQSFEREDWGRGFRPTDEPAFRRLSRFGVVPVIDDGGFVLRESNVIVRYLASKHGRSDLYPTDLAARASAEVWMDWASTDLFSAIRPVFMSIQLKMPIDPKQIDTGIVEWRRQMQLLDAHLASTGPYVSGGSFTVGDICVGLAVNRWFSINFDKPELKSVSTYYDRLSERPAYRAHGRNGTP